MDEKKHIFFCLAEQAHPQEERKGKKRKKEVGDIKGGRG